MNKRPETYARKMGSPDGPRSYTSVGRPVDGSTVLGGGRSSPILRGCSLRDTMDETAQRDGRREKLQQPLVVLRILDVDHLIPEPHVGPSSGPEVTSSRPECAPVFQGLLFLRDPRLQADQLMPTDGSEGNLALVRRLLHPPSSSSGSTVDVRNPDPSNGLTSLSYAAIGGYEDLFEYLVFEEGHDDDELSRVSILLRRLRSHQIHRR